MAGETAYDYGREERITLKSYQVVCKICDNIATFKGYCAAHKPYAVMARECRDEFTASTQNQRIAQNGYQTFRALEMYKELSDEAKDGICFLCAALLVNAQKRDANRDANQGAANLGPLGALEIVFGLTEAEYL